MFAVIRAAIAGPRQALLKRVLLLLPALSGGAVLAAEAPRVVVDVAQEAEIVRQLPLTGTITAAKDSRLSAEIEGRVRTVYVDIGDRVEAGQTLLLVDNEIVELSFRATQALTEQSRAELMDARRRYADAQRLRKQGSISENEILLREAEVQIKTAALKRQEAEEAKQKAQVEHHAVRAPFDGVISAKLTEEGEWVTPGSAILQLVATESLFADFAVPQDFYAHINDNSRVILKLDPSGRRTLIARVHAVVPVNDPSARTFLMRVRIEEQNAGVTPGMSVNGELQVSTGKRGVVISRDAVLRYPDGRVTVWVVAGKDGESVVSERHVRIGLGFDNKLEIREGLDAGAVVVVQGNEALEEGQLVLTEKAR